MPRIKKIGTPLVKYYGKSLFEIVANLKNVGAGRMVSRTSWQQYPQKSFIIISRAYPSLKTEDFERGIVYGKKVFRNFPITEEQKITDAFIPDWYLIPKHEEKQYFDSLPPPPPKVVPKYIEIPPLLNLLLLRDVEKAGKNEEKPKIPIKIETSANVKFAE